MKNYLVVPMLILASCLSGSKIFASSCIGLVDPTRSASGMIDEVLQRGYCCVIVESGLEGQNPQRSRCTHLVTAQNDLNETARKLRELGVVDLIPGVEGVVLFSDQLKSLLGLAGNGLLKSEARRNKTLMHQEVARAGLRVPKQAEIATLDGLHAWLAANRVSYPIVLKPVDGAGSQDVNFCASEAAAGTVIEQVVGKKNVFGHSNEQLIAQEYVDGEEYFVNAVTFGGKHFISDIWLYSKGIHNGRSFVYEKATLLEPTGPAQNLLKAYALKVLDALDFRTGASHMEIKINSKGEVILIEVGARIAGADFHLETRAATLNRKSQLEYIIDASVNKTPDNSEYELEKGAIAIFLVSTQEGRVVGHRHLDEIKALPSFHRMKVAEVGSKIQKTVDLFTTPGSIRLVNADRRQLQLDGAAVDRLLQTGLFEVE